MYNANEGRSNDSRAYESRFGDSVRTPSVASSASSIAMSNIDQSLHSYIGGSVVTDAQPNKAISAKTKSVKSEFAGSNFVGEAPPSLLTAHSSRGAAKIGRGTSLRNNSLLESKAKTPPKDNSDLSNRLSQSCYGQIFAKAPKSAHSEFNESPKESFIKSSVCGSERGAAIDARSQSALSAHSNANSESAADFALPPRTANGRAKSAAKSREKAALAAVSASQLNPGATPPSSANAIWRTERAAADSPSDSRAAKSFAKNQSARRGADERNSIVSANGEAPSRRTRISDRGIADECPLSESITLLKEENGQSVADKGSDLKGEPKRSNEFYMNASQPAQSRKSVAAMQSKSSIYGIRRRESPNSWKAEIVRKVSPENGKEIAEITIKQSFVIEAPHLENVSLSPEIAVKQRTVVEYTLQTGMEATPRADVRNGNLSAIECSANTKTAEISENHSFNNRSKQNEHFDNHSNAISENRSFNNCQTQNEHFDNRSNAISENNSLITRSKQNEHFDNHSNEISENRSFNNRQSQNEHFDNRSNAITENRSNAISENRSFNNRQSQNEHFDNRSNAITENRSNAISENNSLITRSKQNEHFDNRSNAISENRSLNNCPNEIDYSAKPKIQTETSNAIGYSAKLGGFVEPSPSALLSSIASDAQRNRSSDGAISPTAKSRRCVACDANSPETRFQTRNSSNVFLRANSLSRSPSNENSNLNDFRSNEKFAVKREQFSETRFQSETSNNRSLRNESFQNRENSIENKFGGETANRRKTQNNFSEKFDANRQTDFAVQTRKRSSSRVESQNRAKTNRSPTAFRTESHENDVSLSQNANTKRSFVSGTSPYGSKAPPTADQPNPARNKRTLAPLAARHKPPTDADAAAPSEQSRRAAEAPNRARLPARDASRVRSAAQLLSTLQAEKNGRAVNAAQKSVSRPNAARPPSAFGNAKERPPWKISIKVERPIYKDDYAQVSAPTLYSPNSYENAEQPIVAAKARERTAAPRASPGAYSARKRQTSIQERLESAASATSNAEIARKSTSRVGYRIGGAQNASKAPEKKGEPIRWII